MLSRRAATCKLYRVEPEPAPPLVPFHRTSNSRKNHTSSIAPRNMPNRLIRTRSLAAKTSTQNIAVTTVSRDSGVQNQSDRHTAATVTHASNLASVN